MNLTFFSDTLRNVANAINFKAKSPTLPSFVALAFQNELQYQNAVRQLNSADDASTCF